MCKKWNSEDECYDYGHYEDGAFIPDNYDIPEPADDPPDIVGQDALRDIWDRAV